MYVRMYVCMYVCMYVRVFMYVCMYVCMTEPKYKRLKSQPPERLVLVKVVCNRMGIYRIPAAEMLQTWCCPAEEEPQNHLLDATYQIGLG